MQKHRKYEEQLMEVIGFDEADLEANRAGELSEWQKASFRQLSERWLNRTDWWVAVVILAVGISLWSGIFGASVGDLIAGFAVLTGVAVTTIQYFSFRRRQVIKFVTENHVPAVEGRVQLNVYMSNYDSTYRLQIDGIGFKVKKSVFLAFKNGDPYRIYYVPHTNQILSVEWLRDDDDNLLE